MEDEEHGVMCGECEMGLNCANELHAQRLYELGYRKLPENAVVLTKTGIAERWIDLLTEFDEMGFEPTTLPTNDMSVEEYTAFYKARLLEFLAQARKETARAILKALKAKQVICSLKEDNFVYMLDIDELAKQYGVEVEE